MTPRRLKALMALVGGVVMLAGAATALAQRIGGGVGAPRQVAPIEPNTPYDGRFTFVRLRYGPPTSFASQRIPWSHDYPTGERNLMRILNEISDLSPRTSRRPTSWRSTTRSSSSIRCPTCASRAAGT